MLVGNIIRTEDIQEIEMTEEEKLKMIIDLTKGDPQSGIINMPRRWRLDGV